MNASLSFRSCLYMYAYFSFFFRINFEDNFLGPPLPVSMKFILIKLPDQQQKKTPHFSIHLASEPQTYFWSLLLCKNLFFGGREVTTGYTSAVCRLPYIQSVQSRFCKKGLFICQKKWTIKSIKFCELSPSTFYKWINRIIWINCEIFVCLFPAFKCRCLHWHCWFMCDNNGTCYESLFSPSTFSVCVLLH